MFEGEIQLVDRAFHETKFLYLIRAFMSLYFNFFTNDKTQAAIKGPDLLIHFQTLEAPLSNLNPN